MAKPGDDIDVMRAQSVDRPVQRVPGDPFNKEPDPHLRLTLWSGIDRFSQTPFVRVGSAAVSAWFSSALWIH